MNLHASTFQALFVDNWSTNKTYSIYRNEYVFIPFGELFALNNELI